MSAFTPAMPEGGVQVLGTGPVLALGVDAGSTTCKIVGIDAAQRIVVWSLQAMSPRVEEQTQAMLAQLRQSIDVLPDAPVYATGYGRKLVPGAHRCVTEITCHARGVFADTGCTGTLIDIGGQDSKVIRIGAGGVPIDFAMNDKCAAGTGRFLENTAQRLHVSLPDMGACALAAQHAEAISSTCTVFAESEIISLVAHGKPVGDILLGLHKGLIHRILAMARGVGLSPPILLSGGVARNSAVVSLLQQASGEAVRLPSLPQLMGAYGAALLAASQSVPTEPASQAPGTSLQSSFSIGAPNCDNCTAPEAPPDAQSPPDAPANAPGGFLRRLWRP